jgi:uncharacterized membrane protein YgaE (UPF0421/DUF939 family)
MTLLEFKQKIADRVSASRMAILSLMLTGLVGMASAAALNDSIAPIIAGVTLLFVPLLAVIVAGVPVIVTIAIISFILGILAMILGKLR